MADIIVNNLPMNADPVQEDVVLLIKNLDGTLTRVPIASIIALCESDDESTFEATYGTSTWADIGGAIIDGKIVWCPYQNRKYYLTRTLPIGADVWCIFTATNKDGSISWIELDSRTNTWTNGSTSAPVSSVDGKTGAVAVLPSGGSSGQVLKKSSGTDYDVEWANESGGGGSSPSPYTSNPAALGTASPGSSDNYARGDHVHPKPFIPEASASNPEPLGTASPGVSLYYARADHAHPKPTASDLGITVPAAATATPSDLGTAAVGSSSKYAKEDHVHNKPTYTASDVGAVAVAQGVGHAGEFLVVGSDGNVTTVTLSTWQGGSY